MIIEQNKIFYTYELIDPRNNKPFYIGKGINGRMYNHVYAVKHKIIPNNNKYLYNKLKKILKENLNPIYKKILETNNEQEAFDKEIELIKFYNRKNLCNLTDGGEGTSNKVPWNKGKSGYKIKGRTEESKKRSSEALKNSIKHKNSMKDPDVRKNIKIRKLKYYENGGVVWNKGLTKETNKRIKKYSNKLLNRTFSDEHRENLSISHLGICPSEETRKKMSVSQKRRYERK